MPSKKLKAAQMRRIARKQDKAAAQHIWDEFYAQLIEYGMTNDDYNVPPNYSVKSDDGRLLKLGLWLQRQGQELNKMRKSHPECYNDIMELVETGKLWFDNDTKTNNNTNHADEVSEMTGSEVSNPETSVNCANKKARVESKLPTQTSGMDDGIEVDYADDYCDSNIDNNSKNNNNFSNFSSVVNTVASAVPAKPVPHLEKPAKIPQSAPRFVSVSTAELMARHHAKKTCNTQTPAAASILPSSPRVATGTAEGDIHSKTNNSKNYQSPDSVKPSQEPKTPSGGIRRPELFDPNKSTAFPSSRSLWRDPEPIVAVLPPPRSHDGIFLFLSSTNETSMSSVAVAEDSIETTDMAVTAVPSDPTPAGHTDSQLTALKLPSTGLPSSGPSNMSISSAAGSAHSLDGRGQHAPPQRLYTDAAVAAIRRRSIRDCKLSASICLEDDSEEDDFYLSTLDQQQEHYRDEDKAATPPGSRKSHTQENMHEQEDEDSIVVVSGRRGRQTLLLEDTQSQPQSQQDPESLALSIDFQSQSQPQSQDPEIQCPTQAHVEETPTDIQAITPALVAVTVSPEAPSADNTSSNPAAADAPPALPQTGAAAAETVVEVASPLNLQKRIPLPSVAVRASGTAELSTSRPISVLSNIAPTAKVADQQVDSTITISADDSPVLNEEHVVIPPTGPTPEFVAFAYTRDNEPRRPMLGIGMVCNDAADRDAASLFLMVMLPCDKDLVHTEYNPDFQEVISIASKVILARGLAFENGTYYYPDTSIQLYSLCTFQYRYCLGNILNIIYLMFTHFRCA